MSQQWYIRRQGQVYGPYTSSTLNVDSVLPTDELGQSQQGPWKPASSFPSFATKSNLQTNNLQVNQPLAASNPLHSPNNLTMPPQTGWSSPTGQRANNLPTVKANPFQSHLGEVYRLVCPNCPTFVDLFEYMEVAVCPACGVEINVTGVPNTFDNTHLLRRHERIQKVGLVFWISFIILFGIAAFIWAITFPGGF